MSIRQMGWVLAAMLVALVAVSPVHISAWELKPGGLQPAAFPVSAVSLEPLQAADLDGDGTEEQLLLTGSRLAIISRGRAAWWSPPDWRVAQAAVADLDGDARPEAVMLVWRSYRPWPVDRLLAGASRTQTFQDANGQSCQVILVGWRRGAFREVWAGSALSRPVRQFQAADLNRDGALELVTLEGDYAFGSHPSPSSAVAVWEWNGFGFTLLSRVPASPDHFALQQTNTGEVRLLF